MDKPSWFQPLDLIPLVFAASCAIYAFAVGFESAHRVQATILLILAPSLMWIIWGYGMWRRKKFLDSCVWYPTYRIMLQPEQWLPPAEFEFDNFVASVVRSWSTYFPQADRVMKRHVKWIYMKKNLAEKPINSNYGLNKGITVAGGSLILVDYNEKLDTIEKTALAHEFGHVIQGLSTGVWDQKTHHDFSKKNHLR